MTNQESAPDVADVVRRALSDLEPSQQLTRFPRRVLESIAASGLLRERWAGPAPGNVPLGMALAEEVARKAPGGIAVGISLHTESVLSLLGRFSQSSSYLSDLYQRALDAKAIGSIAASEPTGGSDLSAIRTVAVPTPDGWLVSGRKKYVSLGAVGDFAIVLCRLANADGSATERLATVVVPLDQATVTREHAKIGTQALDTVAIELDKASVPAGAMLGRPGLGLVNISYALSFERLAIAAQVAGAVDRALSLAVEHSDRREQFGAPLRSHQHLEFRLADVLVELEVIRGSVRYLATQLQIAPLNRALMAQIAAVKVHAARKAEQLVSECMQVFGGAGYLPDETPLGRLWQDVRLARIGGGTDEMMLSIVAGELKGDPDLYNATVRIST